MARTSRQIAALPYRLDVDGRALVMLITSRDTRRWVIPKGNHMTGVGPPEAAAAEAFEEGGIAGLLCPTALGDFVYDKRLKNGRVQKTRVVVFPIQVTREFAEWPEDQQRIRRWFSHSDAVAAVDEPQLKAIIDAFMSLSTSRMRQLW